MRAGTETRFAVFISYARSDLAFADRLAVALKQRGVDALIDRTEIYAFEDWWKRIEQLVVRADTVIFVLSPASVASEVCRREVAFAGSLNKRLAPIICRPVNVAAIPAELARLNYIDFTDDAQFDVRFGQLAEALSVDIEWLRTHTDIGERARRWSAAGRPGGLQLRSPELEDAERWIASRPRDAPEPTEVARALILESRRGTTRWRNIVTASLAAGFVVAATLAGVAYWQWEVAARRRDQALIAESYFLADRSRAEADAGNMTTASLLAMAALPDSGAGSVRPLLPAAKLALLNSVQRLGDAVLRGHEAPVLTVAFSLDGSRVVSGSLDRSALLWDARSAAPIAKLTGHLDVVSVAEFSADGRRIVTGSGDKTARVWDGLTGAPVAKLQGHTAAVLGAAFSIDGTCLATASEDGTIGLWDGVSGARRGRLVGHHGAVTMAAFSPDGTRLATASADATARLWDVATGNLSATLIGHTEKVNSVAFSPDGARIVTASADNDVRLWDGNTGAALATFSGHTDAVLGAVFSPDGQRIVSASTDTSAQVWDVATVQSIAELTANGAILSAGFSPDQRHVVTASSDKTVRIWDAASGAAIATFDGHSGAVGQATYSRDGASIVSASHDGTVRLWQVEPGIDMITFVAHSREVLAETFVANSDQVFTVGGNGAPRTWDARTGMPVSPPAETREFYSKAAVSADTKHIVLVDIDWAVVVDASTGAQQSKFKASEEIGTAAIDPAGTRIVTLAYETHTPEVWDAHTGAALGKLVGHTKEVKDARFSSDGRRIVTASWDGTARLWDVASLAPIATISDASAGNLTRATLSADDSRLVTVSRDNSVRIWDLDAGRIVAVLKGHKANVASAEFSPDGGYVVTASDDETVRVWDAAAGALLAVLVARKGKVANARFSPDGHRIVATLPRGQVVVWSLFPLAQDLVDRSRQLVSRCLSADERIAAHLDPVPPAWCAEKQSLGAKAPPSEKLPIK